MLETQEKRINLMAIMCLGICFASSLEKKWREYTIFAENTVLKQSIILI